MREFVIGCDNAAVDLKNALKATLETAGYKVEDVGCHAANDPIEYPLVAEKACEIIAESGYQKRGVLVCGTGIGMCITANKCRGVRAAVGHDIFSARRSILSNDAHVLCFGERVIGVELAKAILLDWAPLEFVDGPSTPKVEQIMHVEARNLK